MDHGSMVLIIPIMALCIPFFVIWTKHQRKIAEIQLNATANSTAERAAQYASQVKELEERVRVLERIVTDEGYDLARKIENLRDEDSASRVVGKKSDTSVN